MPRRKILKLHALRLILMAFLHTRNNQVSTNLLNFREPKVIFSQLNCKYLNMYDSSAVVYVKSYTFSVNFDIANSH